MTMKPGKMFSNSLCQKLGLILCLSILLLDLIASHPLEGTVNQAPLPLLDHPFNHTNPESFSDNEFHTSSLAQMTNTPAGIRARVTAVIKRKTKTTNFMASLESATSVVKDFGTDDFFISNGDGSGNGATVGLSGCTVLIAISSSSLYVGHYWEKPGFGSKVGFAARVLKFIQQGHLAWRELNRAGDAWVNFPDQPSLLQQTSLQDQAIIHILSTARELKVGDSSDTQEEAEKSSAYPTRIKELVEVIVGPQKTGFNGPVQGVVAPFRNARIMQPTYYYVDNDPDSLVDYSIEYSGSDGMLRVMISGARPRVLMLRDVKKAWDTTADGTPWAWSN